MEGGGAKEGETNIACQVKNTPEATQRNEWSLGQTSAREVTSLMKNNNQGD